MEFRQFRLLANPCLSVQPVLEHRTAAVEARESASNVDNQIRCDRMSGGKEAEMIHLLYNQGFTDVGITLVEGPADADFDAL